MNEKERNSKMKLRNITEEEIQNKIKEFENLTNEEIIKMFKTDDDLLTDIAIMDYLERALSKSDVAFIFSPLN
jgi:hypothetical protein